MIGRLFQAPAFHAALVALANAIVQAVSAFGVHLSGSQNVAITALMNALLLVLSLGFAAIGNAAAAKGG